MGADACSHLEYHDMEKLLKKINGDLWAVVGGDLDAVVDEAMAIMREELDRTSTERETTTAQLRKVEKAITRQHQLIGDPDVMENPAAKRAFIRKAGELEAERDALRGQLEKLAEKTHLDATRLTKAIGQAVKEAREAIAAAGTPAQVAELLLVYTGGVVVARDGSLRPRDGVSGESAPDTPSQAVNAVLRTLFWRRLAA